MGGPFVERARNRRRNKNKQIVKSIFKNIFKHIQNIFKHISKTKIFKTCPKHMLKIVIRNKCSKLVLFICFYGL